MQGETETSEALPLDALFVNDRVGARLIGVGATRFAELQREADFPSPVWLGARCKRHRKAALLEWAASRNAKPAMPAHRPGDKVRTAASALGCALLADLDIEGRVRWERAGRPGLVKLHRHELITGQALRRLGIALPRAHEAEHV